jgi:hypothetical protein
MDDANVFFVTGQAKTAYTDFLEKPTLLVSDEFKKVAKLYNKAYKYDSVALTEEESELQTMYWHIEMPYMNCLSEKTGFHHDGTLKNIVIAEKRAEGKAMLRLKNKLWDVYIVRLDMAESILRRALCGFIMEPVGHE